VADIYENVNNVVELPPSKVIVDPKHPPLELKKFPAHFQKLKKDTYHQLSEEYKVSSLHSITCFLL